jgi:hypothetical protein
MKKLTVRSLGAVLAWMMLTAWCTTGCGLLKRKVVVIPADRQINYLAPGDSYRATNAVYLVPPALLQDMLRVFNRLQTNK